MPTHQIAGLLRLSLGVVPTILADVFWDRLRWFRAIPVVLFMVGGFR